MRKRQEGSAQTPVHQNTKIHTTYSHMRLLFARNSQICSDEYGTRHVRETGTGSPSFVIRAIRDTVTRILAMGSGPLGQGTAALLPRSNCRGILDQLGMCRGPHHAARLEQGEFLISCVQDYALHEHLRGL